MTAPRPGGAPIKRNVGIGPHIDAWVRNFAERRSIPYAGAINVLLLAGLDQLDPEARDAPKEPATDDQ